MIRGHPDVVPTKVGTIKDWVPVFTGTLDSAELSDENGAGMTVLIEAAIYKQTLIKSMTLKVKIFAIGYSDNTSTSYLLDYLINMVS